MNSACSVMLTEVETELLRTNIKLGELGKAVKINPLCGWAVKTNVRLWVDGEGKYHTVGEHGTVRENFSTDEPASTTVALAVAFSVR